MTEYLSNKMIKLDQITYSARCDNGVLVISF